MIRTCQVNETLHIILTGRLCLSAVYELTGILAHVADSCEEYQLDMQGVSTITDAGLSILTMFARHVHRWGRRIRVVGCNDTLRRRLVTMPVLAALIRPDGDTVTAKPAPSQRSTAVHRGFRLNMLLETIHPGWNSRELSPHTGGQKISWH